MNSQTFKPDRQYRAYWVLLSACLTAFIPGSMIFGFPGVMGSYWQKTFNAGRAETGQILFYVLAAAGLHMFLIGRLQERMRPFWIAGMGAIIYGSSLMMLGRATHMSGVYIWADFYRLWFFFRGSGALAERLSAG